MWTQYCKCVFRRNKVVFPSLVSSFQKGNIYTNQISKSSSSLAAFGGYRDGAKLKKPPGIKYTGTEKNEHALLWQLESSIEEEEKEDNEEENRSELTGKVMERKRFMVTVSGLRNARPGSWVSLGNGGGMGYVVQLHKELTTLAVVRDGHEAILRGMEVTLLENIILKKSPGNEIDVGTHIEMMDIVQEAATTLELPSWFAVNTTVPSIVERGPIVRPLTTGLRVVDALQPIAYGERMAIIGPHRGGKSLVAMDILSHIASCNMKNDKKTVCIYVAIGKSEQALGQIQQVLNTGTEMENTLLISTLDTDPYPLQYLTPFCATQLASSYVAAGNDVVLVHDDISTHTAVVDEMTDVMGCPSNSKVATLPGSALLMEKAGQLSSDGGGGSLTALALASIEPTATSLYGGFTGTIISKVDHHIVLDKGHHPYPHIASLTSSRVPVPGWHGWSSTEGLLGVHSARGPPIQNHFLWKCMENIRHRLLECHQLQARVDAATALQLDTEEGANDHLEWRKVVECLWNQKPLQQDYNPTELALGAYLLLTAERQVVPYVTEHPSFIWDLGQAFWSLVEKVTVKLEEEEGEMVKDFNDYITTRERDDAAVLFWEKTLENPINTALRSIIKEEGK